MDEFQTTLFRRMDNQDKVLEALKTALVGNVEFQQKGVVQEMRELKSEIKAHIKDDNEQFGELKTFKIKLTALATSIGLSGGAIGHKLTEWFGK